MRISPQQIQDLKGLLLSTFSTHPFQVYLYGSRIHDNIRGGDFDFLIVTTEDGVELFEAVCFAVFVDLKKKKSFGQRQIDMKAITRPVFENDPFWQAIAPEMVLL